LGPGVLESAYETCLAHECEKRGLKVVTQLQLPIVYDGITLEVGYRIDLLIGDTVVVELKTVKKLTPLHEAQLLSYLRLSGYKVGLLINFHVSRLTDGIKRRVNNWNVDP
jgi:GxxExxY protein